jgi:predicted nucleic acid-binding protein
MIIVLDSGPAGLIVHPRGSRQSHACIDWLERMILAGHSVALPEIVDYEVRREVLRRRNFRSLRKLNQIATALDYLPITTEVMHRAAELWAIARQRGRPTADDKAIDGDMILVAQTTVWSAARKEEAIIATTNVGHLARFTAARNWQDISAS